MRGKHRLKKEKKDSGRLSCYFKSITQCRTQKNMIISCRNYLETILEREDAIVGAGSVVTKDVPDYAVAVGNPAKVIKMLDKEKFKEDVHSRQSPK